MIYNTFLNTVKETLQNRLGEEYHVMIQQIPKNNGTMMDGLCIMKPSERITPTIYLNTYYNYYEDGSSMDEILSEILSLYMDNTRLPQIEPDQFTHFDHLKEKIVYKLINTTSNTDLLKTVPSIPYLDLSIVFYLLLDENEFGYMTALIQESHMADWKTNIEELYQLASVNTPYHLPAELKSMSDVIKELAMEKLGEDYREDFIRDLIEHEDSSPLFVLTNRPGLNGASALLYDHVLKSFAEQLNQDLVILPSSIHEVLLVPYDDDVNFGSLSHMVSHINQTEVAPEDRLSNEIYLYSRLVDQVSAIPNADESSTYS